MFSPNSSFGTPLSAAAESVKKAKVGIVSPESLADRIGIDVEGSTLLGVVGATGDVDYMVSDEYKPAEQVDDEVYGSILAWASGDETLKLALSALPKTRTRVFIQNALGLIAEHAAVKMPKPPAGDDAKTLVVNRALKDYQSVVSATVNRLLSGDIKKASGGAVIVKNPLARLPSPQEQLEFLTRYAGRPENQPAEEFVREVFTPKRA